MSVRAKAAPSPDRLLSHGRALAPPPLLPAPPLASLRLAPLCSEAVALAQRCLSVGLADAAPGVLAVGVRWLTLALHCAAAPAPPAAAAPAAPSVAPAGPGAAASAGARAGAGAGGGEDGVSPGIAAASVVAAAPPPPPAASFKRARSPQAASEEGVEGEEDVEGEEGEGQDAAMSTASAESQCECLRTCTPSLGLLCLVWLPWWCLCGGGVTALRRETPPFLLPSIHPLCRPQVPPRCLRPCVCAAPFLWGLGWWWGCCVLVPPPPADDDADMDGDQAGLSDTDPDDMASDGGDSDSDSEPPPTRDPGATHAAAVEAFAAAVAADAPVSLVHLLNQALLLPTAPLEVKEGAAWCLRELSSVRSRECAYVGGGGR